MRKDVSIGEFDVATGLTYVTQQRGRLLFNMGHRPPKGVAPTPSAPLVTETTEGTENSTLDAPSKPKQRVFQSGVFTGRALYAEEVYYLLQRNAIVVYEAQEVEEATEDNASSMNDSESRVVLTIERFVRLVIHHGWVSLPCMDAYIFLKDNKLHPRRHVKATDDAMAMLNALRLGNQTLRLTFDVSKTFTETVYVEEVAAPKPIDEDDAAFVHQVAPDSLSHPIQPVQDVIPKITKKRKVKELRLIFRALVCPFRDPMPSPQVLRQLVEQTTPCDETGSVPIKVAVVHADRSVLLFEIA
ncbi:hypothetical protein Poli38472_005606 [Pythium oligandrum]|uniref:tRNA-splicing endonuclease subunit Sen54 N-terminal domain-containing protein n=1 Tax=Pythium oligandrum TaxID=41045 RepID=A0A8K1CHB1_PYTOL|nr:hypothetical protein Poli38472_005606 [Pythium oligandrum]|eukprot:TMW62988.1 hypothetical protein Poli38472_005606 [Pythium oligandrum]